MLDSLRAFFVPPISADPGDSYGGSPLQINDNTISNSTSYGIYINIVTTSLTDSKIVCENNSITDAGRDGIFVNGDIDKCRSDAIPASPGPLYGEAAAVLGA